MTLCESERDARLRAENECHRLTLLADISEEFAATLDPDEAVELLARRLVPRLGRWSAIYLLDDAGALCRVIGHHRDRDEPAVSAAVELFTANAASALAHDSSTMRILRGEVNAALIVQMDRGATAAPLQSNTAMMDVVESLGLGSAVVVPLRARGRLLGAFRLTGGSDRADYDEDDVRLVVELARRAALALDNARLYARERAVAETLQRSLLPDLPTIAGIRLCAEYLPASSGARVGGDWFDAIPLPDGATGLAIGDVMGHDIAAAVSMGQFRSVLRSYAWEGSDPVEVLDRLDRLVQGLGMARLATCIYARVELTSAAGRRLHWANAGHPPPILRTPDGQVRLLDDASGVLIGIPPPLSRHGSRRSATVDLEPGSLLLLYTDGLIENRRTDLDHGLDELLRTVRAGAADESGPVICERLVAPLRGQDREDDVALLAVSFQNPAIRDPGSR